MAKLLTGKEVSAALADDLAPRIERLSAVGVIPTLAIVRVGGRPDDLSYERTACKRAEALGFAVRRFELPANAPQGGAIRRAGSGDRRGERRRRHPRLPHVPPLAPLHG